MTGFATYLGLYPDNPDRLLANVQDVHLETNVSILLAGFRQSRINVPVFKSVETDRTFIAFERRPKGNISRRARCGIQDFLQLKSDLRLHSSLLEKSDGLLPLSRQSSALESFRRLSKQSARDLI